MPVPTFAARAASIDPDDPTSPFNLKRFTGRKVPFPEKTDLPGTFRAAVRLHG